ncbi:MAG: class I SAM-dependent methyltransferase [Actinomycetia bacterium]|nr:class I SAM-dependent methyltransferase [Actinomycetes bacterium]
MEALEPEPPDGPAQSRDSQTITATLTQVQQAVEAARHDAAAALRAAQHATRVAQRTEERARSGVWLTAQEVSALNFLQQALPQDRLLPPLGGWSMDYSVVAVIHDYARALSRPAVMVELGSGAGTPWLGLIAAQNGGRLLSIEHDEAFVASTSRLVQHYGLSDSNTMVHAPLTEREDGDPWFSISSIDEALPGFLGSDLLDVLIVDGPPSGIGPYARTPALSELAAHLRHGALVVLDDTVRPEEKQIWSWWLEEFADQLEPYPLQLTNASMALWRGDRNT